MNAATAQLPHHLTPDPLLVNLPNIAIVGKMGAGKTTGADILVRNLGYNRASFAALLKEVAVLIWGDQARTDRRKLQEFGTAVRQIDENAWVGALERRIAAWRGPIVIDDCRFPNEYWALKHRGFKFIRVRADEAVREDRLIRIGKLQSRDQFQHISETALDDIDADLGLINDGSEADFEANLIGLVDRLNKQVI